MLKIFNSPFRVTQAFGVNPEYYSQFGLRAHEGTDLIPTTSDRAIFSMPYAGVVVLDSDNPKSGAYGIHCTIWYPSINKAFEYCHMSENKVVMGQQISPKTWIGIMGGTGNVQGDHLHLNQFETDANGVRLNRNNGYFGGVDPLPFINGDEPGNPTPPPASHPEGGDVNLFNKDDNQAWKDAVGITASKSPDLVSEQEVSDAKGSALTPYDWIRQVLDMKFENTSKENYDKGFNAGKASVPTPIPPGSPETPQTPTTPEQPDPDTPTVPTTPGVPGGSSSWYSNIPIINSILNWLFRR